jgi:peptidoglycan/xylan/chitin deacetylase (PgdA/CDA1 family)/glycosyltransferase involved in cell wall biosynthesis
MHRPGRSRAAAEATPEVSVIIACRNGADTLPEALDSLAAQAWDRPWEIVFADNGSTDASPAVFRAFAERHPEIPTRALDVAVRGKPHALNAAIRAARGRAILFCDTDDTVAPGWLAAMGAALETRDFVAARLDLERLNPEWTRVGRRNPQVRELAVLSHAPYCPTAGGATLGFHKRVFEAVGGFDPAFAVLEDTDFCVRAHRKGFELALVPGAVYNYRFRAELGAIRRQAYLYARYRALLRRRCVDEPLLAPNRWLGLLGETARLALLRAANRALGRRQGPAERALLERNLGRALGTLAGSLRHGVAPPGAAEGGRPGLPRPLRRALRPVAGSLVAVRTGEKLMALTFDDGPDPASTPELLEALARHGMRATFFLVGERAARHPELVARIAAEGHEIGNHSWDHPALPTLPLRAAAAQLRRARAALAPHGGPLMRPPYGAQSLATHLLARLQGYRVVTWNVSCGDMRGDDAETLAGQVVGAAAPGSIVLLHDTLYSWEDERFRDRGPTINAVGLLAERLPGWRFVTVSELLRAGRPVERVLVSSPPPAYLAGLRPAPAT